MTEKRVPDDDYLWDGSGEPDAEIVRLEALLAPYRHKPLPLVLPARAPAPRRLAAMALQILTAAASLVLVAAAGWFAYAVRPPGWTVQTLAGSPSVGGSRSDAPSRLPIGEVLTTDAGSRWVTTTLASGKVAMRGPNCSRC